MNFIISGRNIDITPGLRQAVEQKLGKLEKYFTPETDIIVTLSVEKERQKIEVIESDTSAAESDEIEIVRTKRFGIKPMFPEDACIQMELLGHNFYVFSNAETDEVNVVYKRKNGTYGLIEPEFQ